MVGRAFFMGIYAHVLWACKRLSKHKHVVLENATIATDCSMGRSDNPVVTQFILGCLTTIRTLSIQATCIMIILWILEYPNISWNWNLFWVVVYCFFCALRIENK
jgi:hypothetical protein